MLAICRTFYSLQTGVRGPKEWARGAAERGYTALAVADANGLYGAVHFYREVAAAGLQPIVGASLTWGVAAECIALATSDRGYRQLCRLLSERHLAAAGFDLLARERDKVSDLLLLTHSPALFRRLAEFADPANVFLLVQECTGDGPDSIGLWDAFSTGAEEIPLPDAWFLEATDREVFDWLYRLRRLSGRGGAGVPEHAGSILPEAGEWLRRFPQAEAVSRRIAERCRFRFRFGRPLFPRIHLPAGACPGDHLRGLCRTAVSERYGPKRRKAAAARLETELTAICDGGFADYFLFVYEIIRFAQTRGIPVEVRGSAASSIVSLHALLPTRTRPVLRAVSEPGPPGLPGHRRGHCGCAPGRSHRFLLSPLGP